MTQTEIKTDIEFINSIKIDLDSSKCENIISYDCSANQDYTFSHVIIATCLSARHVEAVSQHVVTFAKSQLRQPDIQNPTNVDGTKHDGWVAVEIKPINAIVHLFTSEVRERFALEDLLNKINSKPSNLQDNTEGNQ